MLDICVFFMSFMQFLNGAQFLNITCLFLSSACLACFFHLLASAPASIQETVSGVLRDIASAVLFGNLLAIKL